MGENTVGERVRVVTKEGPVIGSLEERDGKNLYSFYRVPYGTPPLGQLRFSAPKPAAPWQEDIDCTKKVCGPVTGAELVTKCCLLNEDCLYVHIVTRDLNPVKPKPVMFWIGCFNYCWSLNILLEPCILVDEDVVFVTCSFRAGPMGFLSIQNVVAPGNAGLKDIVMGLKWVQRNISLFGGDPNNVTLFGSSTGGAIVHLMMLSSMTEGLFHKAIIQSASALNNWALTKNPAAAVVELAKALGIEVKGNDYAEIVEILKTLPAEDIVKAFLDKIAVVEDATDIFNPMFRPCIEEDFEGHTAFLSKSPFLILKSGKFNKVPMIIGGDNIETSLLKFLKYNFSENYEQLNQRSSFTLPKQMASGMNSLSTKLVQQLINFYTGEDAELSDGTKDQYLQMISDYYFLYCVNKSVRFHARWAAESPVYYYVLNFSGDWSVPHELCYMNCGEIPYMFQIRLPAEDRYARGGRDSVRVRSRVIKMWTNFAKYGNPTPDDNDPLFHITWDPVENEDRLNYLAIGTELTKGRNPYYDRMKFWDQLFVEQSFLRTLMYFNDMGVQW
ncbi:hypothetical protein JYU34_006865 [Plutella xylostella]|uniref:Uncharacterized protein n=2 Tax=Plutella xylostella TaxID=51655 RepID=A0ABQ7QT40_PLUXY|nr:acetylcholinesterase [Plutella xylostella]XP_037961814.1 acetylcholinesterase [Plutella xylostella]KAG7308197.1 hypothetical protein JYU34_006865 [Plutella xylostella]CAG9133113.1 unnamed protein product [Plutella xylostella]